MERRLQTAPDKQVSLTDPDSRSMATSGRGSGVVAEHKPATAFLLELMLVFRS